jgi:mono/diheme cytochrome c family protein
VYNARTASLESAGLWLPANPENRYHAGQFGVRRVKHRFTGAERVRTARNGEWKRTMKRRVLQGLVVITLIIGFNEQGRAQQPGAQQPDIGKTEYQSGCAACHGVDGKGAGPVADALKTKPTDLTMIAKKNNGVFPFGRIYDIIDDDKRLSPTVLAICPFGASGIRRRQFQGSVP